jgi:hypothetical protein
MKFDRQIVAIALTNGARVLYSDDDGVKKFEEGSGLKVKRTSDLPIPLIQQQLFEGGKFTLSEQSDSADDGKSAGPEPKPEWPRRTRGLKKKPTPSRAAAVRWPT